MGFVVILIVLILAVYATIEMYKDDVTIFVSSILLFGLYTWDFYSDILFSIEVWVQYDLSNNDARNDTETTYLWLFIFCIVFLVVPVLTGLSSLFRFQDKWTKDPSIGDRVKGWNRDWSTYLLFLTVMSGSC